MEKITSDLFLTRTVPENTFRKTVDSKKQDPFLTGVSTAANRAFSVILTCNP